MLVNQAYDGWGGQRHPLPYPAKALPKSLLDWAGRRSRVIDPFSGCDFGFYDGFGSDYGFGCHSWAIYISRGPCLDMALFLFLVVMVTALVGNPRVLCFLTVDPLRTSLGELKHL